MHRGADEHGAKKRSFAFTLAYIKCFRTYSLYLSLRLPAQILYEGIHLPPQREARALPRRAQIFPLRSVKFGFDFTVCLYSLHSPAIIIGYYISTLHFHIFLLFSISFLMKNTPPFPAGYFFAKIILYGAIYTLSERKIATKETHQGCVFVQVKRRKRRDIFLPV